MRPGSPFYIERNADRRVLEHLDAAPDTVVVRGHRQSGKSSLLARIHARAAEKGDVSCYLDFQGFSSDSFCGPDVLFREIAGIITDQLDLNTEPDDEWMSSRTPKRKLTRFMERNVLPSFDTTIQLLLDEADLVFPHSGVRAELFSMLRAWHNRRASDLQGRWPRLTLVLAHSTDPALWIPDESQSPFNVGMQVRLDDFSRDQVADLGLRYGRQMTDQEIDGLLAFVGGHPWLVRLTLYNFVLMDRSLLELRETCTNEDSPFAPHLQRCLKLLRDDDKLHLVMCEIMKYGACDDEIAFQRLWSAGMIRGDSTEQARLRCDLYRTYFGQRLGCP